MRALNPSVAGFVRVALVLGCVLVSAPATANPTEDANENANAALTFHLIAGVSVGILAVPAAITAIRNTVSLADDETADRGWRVAGHVMGWLSIAGGTASLVVGRYAWVDHTDWGFVGIGIGGLVLGAWSAATAIATEFVPTVRDIEVAPTVRGDPAGNVYSGVAFSWKL